MATDTTDPKFSSRRYFKILDRTVDVALAASPVPLKVLEVGCADGELLRELVQRVPYANQYVGIDTSAAFIEAAKTAGDSRLDFLQVSPESLPFPAAHFDLVVSNLSFNGWADKLGGLREIARVLTAKGRFVLVEETKSGPVEALIKEAGLVLDQREVVLRSAFLRPKVHAFIVGT